MEKSLSQKASPNKALSTTALLLFCVAFLRMPCEASGIGGESGSYLLLPVGATATGIGGAYTASPDFYAAWWNPSAPAALRDNRIAGGTGLRSLGRMEAFGSFDFRVPGRASRVGIGITALYRGDPSIGTLYDSDENLLPNTSYTTMTIKTALSYYISRRLSAGVAVNVLYQSLPTYGDATAIQYADATSIGSFDFAVSYVASDNWKLAAVMKNAGAKMTWQMGDLAPEVDDRPIPSLTLGSNYAATLAGKPLVWAFDAKIYALDGTWSQLDHAELDLCTGVEWRGWDNFRVRAGIADLPLTGELFGNSETYADDFGVQFTAGFSYKFTKKKNGLWLNYAVATDKIWAGVDQLLDITLAF